MLQTVINWACFCKTGMHTLKQQSVSWVLGGLRVHISPSDVWRLISGRLWASSSPAHVHPHRQPHPGSSQPYPSILALLWACLGLWVWLSGPALVWPHFPLEGAEPGSAVEEEWRKLNVYQTCFGNLGFRQKVEKRGENCVRVALWWTGGRA